MTRDDSKVLGRPNQATRHASFSTRSPALLSMRIAVAFAAAIGRAGPLGAGSMRSSADAALTPKAERSLGDTFALRSEMAGQPDDCARAHWVGADTHPRIHANLMRGKRDA